MIAHRCTIAAAFLAAAIIGCSKGADSEVDSGSGGSIATAQASGKRTGADRNACDLLTDAEVSAAAGVAVKARETNRETGRSDCSWFDAADLAQLTLVGYWVGGQQGWEILAASRAMAKDLIQKNEDVALDSIVQVGPVPGLGDKALFSPLLPSLVLKDDVLLEFTMPLFDKPEAKFKPLAQKALSRL